ncbi:MAG: class I SAM-dependent methyltransferase [Gemmatimonadaceae bacterium]
MQREYGREYAELYAHHWWWRAREAILEREIAALELPQPCAILDVGCGDGVFFPILSRWGTVSGIEIDRDLVSDAVRDRHDVFHEPLGSPVYLGKRFDLITALDVIEHIEDDVGALRAITTMLAPTGYLVLTVPAFKSLWDEHDERNHHFRRYCLERVRELLAPYGRIVRLRYLFPSLFPPKFAVAALNRVWRTGVKQTSMPSPSLSSLLARWLRLEDRLASRLPIPFGTSVLAILAQHT